ncbi:MAG: polysaccharide biosynthesis tyrosine autokinase [Terriglobales bacterium]
MIGTAELIAPQYTHRLDKDMRFRDLWDILVRRRVIVFTTLVACLLAGSLICVFSTTRYKATGELQVGKETDNNLGLQTGSNQEAPETVLEENLTLETQATMLQSDTLALKVIHDLNLESTQDFRPHFNPIGYVMGVFTPDGPPDPHNATLEESPRRRVHALKVFSSHLDVKPVSGTRLIDISYSNPDPKLTAKIVNTLANSLVDYNFQIRHDATSHTAEWLAGQMSDLRKQSEDLQAKVAQLQRETGVFSLGETDSNGREEVYSSVLDKLQQATTAFSQAQANRIGKAAIYQVAQTGDPEAISQLSGNSIFASSSGLDSSLSLIQSMRMQEATLRGQIGEMSAKFGPTYPKLTEMNSHLDALVDSIHTELNRVAERAKNDYKVAQRVEDNARKIYTEQKRQADLVNDKTIDYMIARQEADQSRNLYESLFRELKQSGVLAGFRANNISLVDPARVPARPKLTKLLYMLAALVGGLFLGCGAAVVRDSLDTRIQNPVILESELGQVPLGILPYHRTARSLSARTGKPQTVDGRVLQIEPGQQEYQSRFWNRSRSGDRKLRMPALDEPRSPYVEALRALRTSLLLSKTRTPPQVLLITSSTPGEGKSMLSANFATILAGQRKKVLLVDADLRHPNLHQALNVSSQTGLSWLLASKPTGQAFETAALSVVASVAHVSQLYIVPSGDIPEYPAELLSSDRMRQAINVWRSHFDYVIIDGSPVLNVTDAVILSGLVDLTLLIARYNIVEQQALVRAYGILQSRAGHNNIGVVFNAVQKTAGVYYPAYGYDYKVDTKLRGGQHENS